MLTRLKYSTCLAHAHYNCCHPLYILAVRLGAWMKRTFSLKPALNKIREARKDFRGAENQSKQVELMR